MQLTPSANRICVTLKAAHSRHISLHSTDSDWQKAGGLRIREGQDIHKVLSEMRTVAGRWGNAHTLNPAGSRM
jgi:hypothetical protein